MHFLKGTTIFMAALLFNASCSSSKKAAQPARGEKGLKDYYKDYFYMGVAVNNRMLHGEDSALIVSQFNSLTAENAMKMAPLHPRENEYFWKDGDEIAAFAQKHGMRLRGHNLCWHAQAPKWMFTDAKGDTVSKQVLLRRLKDHITTVVNHYKNSVYGWDVVNEAIDDRDSLFYRQSAWYKICGEDFIVKAFEYAHAADHKQFFSITITTQKTRENERRFTKWSKSLRRQEFLSMGSVYKVTGQ